MRESSASEERPTIDPAFEEVTEGEEEDTRRKLKSKWARLEAMVGTEKRIGLVAQDVVKCIMSLNVANIINIRTMARPMRNPTS